MPRHHRSGGGALAKGHVPPVPENLSLIRTFNSESNPARPIRPSPLTASQIQGIPLDLLDRIRSFPLFLSAPDSFLIAIGSHLRPQVQSAHDNVVTEGDEARAMYWLVRGAVAVTSRDGESTYAELRPGAFFGEIGVLMDIPRTATIVARTRCLLVVLKKEDLMKELPKFPEVERAIREEAQERLTILDRKKKTKEPAPSMQGTAPASPKPNGKRTRDGMLGEVVMGDEGTVKAGEIVVHKRRKSPSPSLAETAASSALGSSMVNVRQLLKELPLFTSLPPEILHFLGLNAQPQTYPPFTDIIRQDTLGREVFFIVRGEVEVVDEKNGFGATNGRESMERRVHVRARLKPGHYFGEVTSLSLAPRRTATVRSITSVECLMIGGSVLDELWERCSPDIRQQVENTAKQRLEAANDEDIIMPDAPESTPPAIDELAIADRRPQTPGKQQPPKVNLQKPAADGHPASGKTEEPFDPDPFLNHDLDNIRFRSRRGSLAPPVPEAGAGDRRDVGPSTPSRKSLSPSPSLNKHAITPPESKATPKRPKLVPRVASHRSQGILPDAVLIKIFQHLDVYQLMRIRSVSIHWSKIISTSPDLLHLLDLTPYNRKVTDDALINYICPFVGSRPRVINVNNCFHITDEGFSALAVACGANVRCWRMKSVWDITAHAVLEMANSAKSLEEIDLSNCRKVSDNLLARVVGWIVPESSASRLHKSHDTARGQGPGTVIGCPKLRRLTLSYCKHVTDRSMAHFAIHAASRLEQLDLTRCTTITDQGFQHWSMYHFSKLRKLCLADCTYLTDNAIVYLTNAAKELRELDLSFCCALSDTATEVLALGCPQLTHLKLSFCGSAVSDGSLRSIGLHLLELQSLSVRGCVRVTGVGVEAVVDGCHKLRAFDVSQCKNLLGWLNSGGVQRIGKRVKFETVAGHELAKL
ncbi:RNI-like protein [Xylona heveae TC161]|uniref:RNI-like protein n=1 Tax=Xylona heveae (strain CBS 132557 / TC161) TaxID=1328760 RepID=A0A165I668_XYLHT|nr:RNI-like protein [Xylona heveae TC161]KZF24442.1 RNI-like protein [Xylona heveae TC161]